MLNKKPIILGLSAFLCHYHSERVPLKGSNKKIVIARRNDEAIFYTQPFLLKRLLRRLKKPSRNDDN